ncbi:hypothetical protein SNEBB_003537 [Seison nebaliae]|nr:hypothetical protein SNEBB_003537 [Seison nebaliae]
MSAKRPKYYTPTEVQVCNRLGDFKVSFLGKVYDLTNLIKAHADSILLKPILEMAGQDISHWFNKETEDIRRFVDPKTCIETYYCPKGRFVHIPPLEPNTNWENDFAIPWWKDSNYFVGFLSKRTRMLKIWNTLTRKSHIVEVCEEETLNEIMERYKKLNRHAGSYQWKYFGTNLDMDKTLEENNVPNHDEECYRLGLNEDEFIEAVSLYFKDDLTED